MTPNKFTLDMEYDAQAKTARLIHASESFVNSLVGEKKSAQIVAEAKKILGTPFFDGSNLKIWKMTDGHDFEISILGSMIFYKISR
jgi:hypothetical protein